LSSPPTSGSPRIFHVVAPWRYLIRAAVVCGLVLLVISLGVPQRDGWMLSLLALVMLLGLALGAWIMFAARLEISESAIVYYSFGYCVRSSWANVLGYASRVMGMNSVEVLILREPGLELSRWLQIGYGLRPIIMVINLLAGRRFIFQALDRYANMIPVGLFAEDWQASELGRVIGRFAPQALTQQVQ
jgi:hypothetical protein